jgi:hypothetical protein
VLAKGDVCFIQKTFLTTRLCRSARLPACLPAMQLKSQVGLLEVTSPRRMLLVARPMQVSATHHTPQCTSTCMMHHSCIFAVLALRLCLGCNI